MLRASLYIWQNNFRHKIVNPGIKVTKLAKDFSDLHFTTQGIGVSSTGHKLATIYNIPEVLLNCGTPWRSRKKEVYGRLS